MDLSLYELCLNLKLYADDTALFNASSYLFLPWTYVYVFKNILFCVQFYAFWNGYDPVI